MQYTMHKNGWTPIIENIDIKNITQSEINQIARLVAEHTIVVLKKQPQLTVEEELNILHMFKDPSPLFNKKDDHFRHTAVDENGLICRVTAEKNEHGKTGIGANPKDFDWHANVTWRKIREPLIWLRAVRGTAGSVTTYNNNRLTYNSLPDILKKDLKDLKLFIPGGTRHDGTPIAAKEGQENDIDYPPLVYTDSLTGKVGFYCPFLQIKGVIGMQDSEAKHLIKWLGDYTTQEKFVYHHEWQDGDIVLADQWHGIHKRHQFHNLEKRVLHRAALYYPEQDYTIEK